MGFVVALMVVAVAVAILIAVLNAADFTIHLGNHHVEVRGKLTPKIRSEWTDFFKREFSQERPASIRGSRRADGRLSLRFRGPFSEAQRQQIRNFLVHTLCR